MTGENSKAELDKLDKLQEEFEQAMKTYHEHLRADRIDLLREDDKVWKEKEKAWREQFEKVYPSCRKAAEITENDQLQDKLCRIADENRMKENLELLAREHFKEGTSTRFEGNYIVSIYRYGKMVIGFPADAYEIDSDIPIKEMIELRVKPTWSSCLRKETISTGNSVILVDAKTQEIVFQLNSNEETLLVDSFGQTDSNTGRACFMDRVRCQFASLVSVDEYRIAMCLKYATMYSQGRMPDEVYWHTLHEITTLYVLGCISQYGYIFLKKQSQKLRDKARQEWESMATSKRWEAMESPLTEKEKWIR